VIAIEYPGYSVYRASQISEQIIMQDSEIVLSYLVTKFKVKPERVLIMGRSLGTGPACWLATKYHVAGLILVSPFTSIKDVASEHYGIIGGLLVKNRFNNLHNIQRVKCPTLIIHGQQDTVVPFTHGQILNGTLESPRQLFAEKHARVS
jgi:pimeloyl-ACP methyl ester carboxylesterase